MAGVFIVVEGIDGAGKGFVMMKLQEHITERSKKYDHVLLTREPTHEKHGAKLRELLKKHDDPYSSNHEFLDLFTSDRRDHLRHHIEPCLAKGYVVLCDRFKYSTIAFQQAQGIPLAEVIKSQEGFKAADLTILLDLPANTALERVANRAEGTEKFEKLDFQEKVRQNYLMLSRMFPNEKIAVIDASTDKENVWTQVKTALEESKVLPY
ncbi:TPA: dTMP kinase [Candidatus Micrarchaeota archaeon]|nr:MAG: dTMP kinase [Candidatus Micrarchaeota archaeon CG1_02_51_15]HII38464.1 dTMP kinase [Candidatus Micrarchaeota archaeon]